MAFLALIDRKPLDQITVREIAREANVHYATFFRHHASKEALLDSIAAEQINRLVALTIPVLDEVSSEAAIGKLFAYVGDHRRLWTALLTGGAATTMRDTLLRISRMVAQDRASPDALVPVDLMVNCTVSLIFETLAWWLTPDGQAMPVPDVARILHRLLWSLQPF